MMDRFDPPSRQEFEKSGAWGLLTSVDLHECNPETIRDAEAIRRFTRQLCDRLKVTRYGETQVVEFGDDPRVHGYSMTQLIETSLVSAHFAEATDSVYLDVFSCKYYDPAETVAFAQKFFEGRCCRALSILRGSSPALSPEDHKQFAARNIILQPAPRGEESIRSRRNSDSANV